MNAEEERQDHLPAFTPRNLRSPSSQSFTQSMNAEEERQDHLTTFATTIESPSSTSRHDHLPTLVITTKSVPSTSVLTWLHGLRAPPSRPSTSPPTPTLYEGPLTRGRKRNQSLASPLLEGTPTRSRKRNQSLASPLLEGTPTRSRKRNQSLASPLLEGTPTRSHQRNRSLASTPSTSLGDGPAFRKKQKFGPELDVDMVTSPTHLSTPTSEEASLSRIEPLPSSITSTAMSGSDPQSPVPSKTVVDTETYSGLLNMAILLRDVEAFSNRAARAFQEVQRIRKTGTYSKAYSQQRLAELAILEMQLIAEVEAYIKAYRQQHASAEQ